MDSKGREMRDDEKVKERGEGVTQTRRVKTRN